MAFINKTYDEAMTLLVEARNYIAYQQPKDLARLDNHSRLLVSQETMRITSRLTQVMAWLFAQRAVYSGELHRDQALGDEFSLGGEHVCLDETWSYDIRLPAPVRGLLERSYNLYIRVQRLEAMLQRQAAEV